MSPTARSGRSGQERGPLHGSGVLRAVGLAARLTLIPSLLSVAALVAGCGPERGVRVVLITFDTLRYDAFAAAGSMPRTRERLVEGLEFERSYAATSTTQPTHATLLTGLHPWVHGVVRNGKVLDHGLVTVPEILRREGFETAAAVASFPVAGRFGFAQGFDRYDDEFDEIMFRRGWAGYEVPAGQFYSLADHVVARAGALLDVANAGSAAGRKQFFWFHFFDPHGPYGDCGEGEQTGPGAVLSALDEGPESAEREFWKARRLYYEDVASMDRAVERLLRRLEEDRARYVTHVVVTADHGEALGEGGSMGHGKRLLPSQIHVPLAILSPAVEAGSRDTVVGSIDVAPTLLALAGVDPKVLEAGGGRDLTRPRVASRAAGMRRVYPEHAMEVRLDGSRHPLGEPMFYAVSDDGRIVRGSGDGLITEPGGDRPSARWAGLFAGFEKRLQATSTGAAVEPEVMEGLRALGYLD